VSAKALVGAPLYTIAAYEGMGAAPTALRRAGIVPALEVKADLGDVVLSPLKKDTVEGTVRNLRHFKESTSMIYSKMKAVSAEQVIVLGGECSETVGSMAGLADAFGGKGGMLWMDAHGDFNTPESSPSGYIGGMCLALACGRSPGLGIELGKNPPPLADERLVHVGSRALDEPEVNAFNSSPVMLFTAQAVRKKGAEEVGNEAARHLDNMSDWIACHLDLDVVDPRLIPAVSYPTPDGLSVNDVSTIIGALAGTRKLRVLEIAAYNAAKDKNGFSAKRIVDLAGRILT
jgi:arginase